MMILNATGLKSTDYEEYSVAKLALSLGDIKICDRVIARAVANF